MYTTFGNITAINFFSKINMWEGNIIWAPTVPESPGQSQIFSNCAASQNALLWLYYWSRKRPRHWHKHWYSATTYHLLMVNEPAVPYKLCSKYILGIVVIKFNHIGCGVGEVLINDGRI